jgi:hypothetical protein
VAKEVLVAAQIQCELSELKKFGSYRNSSFIPLSKELKDTKINPNHNP